MFGIREEKQADSTFFEENKYAEEFPIKGNDNPNKRVIFSTSCEAPEGLRLRGNPLCLVVVNINSTMGGRCQPWTNNHKRIGVEHQLKKDVCPSRFREIKMDDGTLEIVSCYSMIALSLGKMYRVAQEPGPYEFNFKDP